MNYTNLSTNEITALWTQYFQNSLYVQVFKYFIETCEDEETLELIKETIEVSKFTMQEVEHFFKSEDIDTPVGFTKNDVNLKADKIFHDPFMLLFMEHTLKFGLIASNTSLSLSTRKDIRDLFTELSRRTIELFNKCIDTSLSKGIMVRPPHITVQKGIEFVASKKYMSFFGNRALNTIELTHLFENIKSNTVGEMICMAFGQTSESVEVKEFMKRGLNISKKHIKIFTKIMNESDIDTPIGSNSFVTNSTSRVFSDKLMLYMMTFLSAAGQGNYSTAASASMRFDISLTYQRLSVEIGLFAKDGNDILINNGWLEEPPQVPDRDKLFKA
ncbi:DUF3231 family protein [Filobacillus milosensis]|uniref:DUF3231 family protein n=1 Tax=Filobacillus milosensis TaxID=94137 RepID=A0A4Y8IDE6_9BACI|nr:DUF3231 family protein [Filobacillus milosensis]TFB13910.1 DUF3231 family protein [Filobacillus milosensis]